MTTEEIATSDMFDFYLFPLSRQQYSLRQIDHALADCNDEVLRERVAEAIRLGEEARDLDFDFKGGTRNNEFGPEAKRVDQELDRALGAVSKFLKTTAQAYGETSAQAQLARYAAGRLFPDGVRAVIHLPYVVQEDTVRLILRRVETEPRLGRALRELGASRFIERVAEVHARYQKALRDTRLPQPKFAQVQEARRAGQERLCQIVVLVLARLVTGVHEGDQAKALWKALREVKKQNAAIGRYYKRRRRVTEVDPETGEELEEAEFEEEFEEEDADDVSPPFTAEDVAEASERVIEAIEELGERVADPWSPGKEDDMDEDVA